KINSLSLDTELMTLVTEVSALGYSQNRISIRCTPIRSYRIITEDGEPLENEALFIQENDTWTVYWDRFPKSASKKLTDEEQNITIPLLTKPNKTDSENNKLLVEVNRLCDTITLRGDLVGELKPMPSLKISYQTIQNNITTLRNKWNPTDETKDDTDESVSSADTDQTINNNTILLKECLRQVLNNYNEYYQRKNSCWAFFCGRTKNQDDKAIKGLQSALHSENSDLETIIRALRQCSLTSNTEHSFVRYLAKHENFWKYANDVLNLSAPTTHNSPNAWHRTDAKDQAEKILNNLATLLEINKEEDLLLRVKNEFLLQINAYARYIKYHHIFHDTGIKRAEKLSCDIAEAHDIQSIHLAIYNAMHGANGYESYGFFGSQGVGNHSLSSYLYESIKQYQSDFSLNIHNNISDDIHHDSERETRRIIRNISAPDSINSVKY
ncbi:MAG: hypothetical protein LRY43_04695, partial [Gammaproteobacteria bacterium]|nr:hypothetical protein [Gammaproteobacteria bacterium]